MNKSDYYAEIGLKAANRAARKVIEKANKEKKPIPVWKENHVEYVIPAIPEKTMQSKTRQKQF